MKKMLPSLKNLSVAAKLFGGFAILIIIIVLSSLLSILQSDTIRDHALKGQLINDVNDELNIARRNRIAYQLTHDEVSLQANKSAIENMEKITAEGSNFTWDTDARVLFDALRRNIPDYASHRDSFVTLEKVTVETSRELTSPALKSVLDKFISLLEQQGNASQDEIAVLKRLYNLWGTAYDIQSAAGKEGVNTFNSQYGDAVQFINSENRVISSAEKGLALAFLKGMQENVGAYVHAREASQKAASELTVIAEKVSSATEELVSGQTSKNILIIQNVMVQMAVAAVCAVLLGLLVAWLITRQMTRQIKHNLALAERIA